METEAVPSKPPAGQEIFVTVSDALEYLFCPRFIFFERCLMIPEHQEKRYKVLKGRELHESREKVNRDYVRKKLHCVKKEISVYLTSHKYHFKGEVDEILFLEDGTAAPLDYKFAEFKDTVYRTHKYQAALYGLLICRILCACLRFLNLCESMDMFPSVFPPLRILRMNLYQ